MSWVLGVSYTPGDLAQPSSIMASTVECRFEHPSAWPLFFRFLTALITRSRPY